MRHPDVGFEGAKRALTALRAQGRLLDADWPRTCGGAGGGGGPGRR
ncbi:hypothetical protein [Streptomyces sp. NPDC058308]